jgi:hypothetical protein
MVVMCYGYDINCEGDLYIALFENKILKTGACPKNKMVGKKNVPFKEEWYLHGILPILRQIHTPRRSAKYEILTSSSILRSAACGRMCLKIWPEYD